jgi:hypothetical protein
MIPLLDVPPPQKRESRLNDPYETDVPPLQNECTLHSYFRIFWIQNSSFQKNREIVKICNVWISRKCLIRTFMRCVSKKITGLQKLIRKVYKLVNVAHSFYQGASTKGKAVVDLDYRLSLRHELRYELSLWLPVSKPISTMSSHSHLVSDSWWRVIDYNFIIWTILPYPRSANRSGELPLCAKLERRKLK